jgi:hypothetical protein
MLGTDGDGDGVEFAEAEHPMNNAVYDKAITEMTIAFSR